MQKKRLCFSGGNDDDDGFIFFLLSFLYIKDRAKYLLFR